nr:hypothetical protein GCM10020093_082860 [Planobispora longispora]
MTIPLHPVSAVAALADALRSRILSGEIEPGTPLPEQELSAAYGVARPTVREALAVLVHEGCSAGSGTAAPRWPRSPWRTWTT